MVLVAMSTAANAGDVTAVGSVCGSGRSLGGGNGNPLQYSAWRIPMEGGDGRATVHRVSKSQIQLK